MEARSPRRGTQGEEGTEAGRALRSGGRLERDEEPRRGQSGGGGPPSAHRGRGTRGSGRRCDETERQKPPAARRNQVDSGALDVNAPFRGASHVLMSEALSLL